MPVDLVIEALGQKPADNLSEILPGVTFTSSGLIEVEEGFQTMRPGVYAGGDLVNGGTTVVQAVAEGRQAAEAISAFLSQKESTPA